jgi:hypothetical protein
VTALPSDPRRVCVEAASRLAGVDTAEVLSPSRAPRVVAARRHAARLLRLQGLSLPEVGRALGRDHTSIMRLLCCSGCGAAMSPQRDQAQACRVCGVMYWAGFGGGAWA